MKFPFVSLLSNKSPKKTPKRRWCCPQPREIVCFNFILFCFWNKWYVSIWGIRYLQVCLEKTADKSWMQPDKTAAYFILFGTNKKNNSLSNLSGSTLLMSCVILSFPHDIVLHTTFLTPGSTCHWMGAKPGSKPIDNLNFLAIVISVIMVFFAFS